MHVGMSQSEITSLRTFIFQAATSAHVIDPQALYPPPVSNEPSDRSTDATCACCISDYITGERIRELPCLHRFHLECIDEWLIAKPLCPVCNCDARNGNLVENNSIPRTNQNMITNRENSSAQV